MGKEYFKTQTEYIEFDSDTNIVTTISDNPEIGCFYYSSFKHRGNLEFEGALYQQKISAKMTQQLQELAEQGNTILSATDEYGRTQNFNVHQMSMRHDYISTSSEFYSVLDQVRGKINNS